MIPIDGQLIKDIMPVLGSSAWKVITSIITEAYERRSKSVRMSHTEIMTATGITSRNTVRDSLVQLWELGVIDIATEDGSASEYTINQGYITWHCKG